jgi:hypothetical protein
MMLVIVIKLSLLANLLFTIALLIALCATFLFIMALESYVAIDCEWEVFEGLIFFSVCDCQTVNFIHFYITLFRLIEHLH